MHVGHSIGKGKTAEVFECGVENEKVMKLFYSEMPIEYIEKEYETSRIIHNLGIPTPYAEELIKWNNQWGIIYEKEVGKNFTREVSTKLWQLKKTAYFFAELQVSFHKKSTEKLIPQNKYLSSHISRTSLLTSEEKSKVLYYLSTLPVDNKVCHGDFHPDNIIINDKKVAILDWMTGTSGNPCGDVAKTLLILKYSYLPEEMSKVTKSILQTIRNWFANFYLHTYQKLTNKSLDEIEKWFLPVMTARLVEGIHPSEKQFLLKMIRQQLVRMN